MIESKIMKPGDGTPDEFGESIAEALSLEQNFELKSLKDLHITRAREFSGKHVVFIGRKILPKPTRKSRNPLKHKGSHRTLTAVYDAILEDLVYPDEIVKCIRVKLDESQLIKVNLDKNQQIIIEVDTFTSVYKKLTGLVVTFVFPDNYLM
uniref:40S ribosomal protein S7 n=1 Tax=Megaselia scalaris TaxID=36166 RepID=T1H640_MEGSC